MRRAPWRARAARASVWLLMLAAGCNCTATDPCIDPYGFPGDLSVSVRTTGEDPDTDGYEVMVDGVSRRPIRYFGAVVIQGLSAGEHVLALTGLEANCSVTGLHPRPVTVDPEARNEVAFEVACLGTGVVVTNVTTGLDLDPDGYLLRLDDRPPSGDQRQRRRPDTTHHR